MKYTLSAVSYTHLDVYKRQELSRLFQRAIIKASSARECEPYWQLKRFAVFIPARVGEQYSTRKLASIVYTSEIN